MTTKPLKYTARGWVISFFYIKPQPSLFLVLQGSSWVISFFYIKPQLLTFSSNINLSWVISFFYIKPQPAGQTKQIRKVGLYPSSTSNHNICHSLVT